MGGLTLQCRACFHIFIFFSEPPKKLWHYIRKALVLPSCHKSFVPYQFSPVEICVGSICTALSSGPSVEFYRAKGVTVALKDPHLVCNKDITIEQYFNLETTSDGSKQACATWWWYGWFNWRWGRRCSNGMNAVKSKNSDSLRPLRAMNVKDHPSGLPPRLSQQP